MSINDHDAGQRWQATTDREARVVTLEVTSQETKNNQQLSKCNDEDSLPVFDPVSSAGGMATPAAGKDHHGDEKNDQNEDERNTDPYEYIGEWPRAGGRVRK